MKSLFNYKDRNLILKALFVFFLVFLNSIVYASGTTSTTLGGVASAITSSFTSVGKLITACSYLGGLAFAIGAIMKFKQHKDNPTQIPIGTPISLLLIGAALLFLPSILGSAGSTLFGSNAQTAGPGGWNMPNTGGGS